MNSLLSRSSANLPADPLMISAIDITAIVAWGTRSWPDLSMRTTKTGHTRGRNQPYRARSVGR